MRAQLNQRDGYDRRGRRASVGVRPYDLPSSRTYDQPPPASRGYDPPPPSSRGYGPPPPSSRGYDPPTPSCRNVRFTPVPHYPTQRPCYGWDKEDNVCGWDREDNTAW